MSKLTKALTAAAGNAGGDNLYAEDVFSTYLYEGTGAGIAINNGINLSDEGGLVIYRRRDGAENWSYQDTERGVNSVIYSDSTNAAADPGGYGLASFNSDGFTTELNTSGADYASWTFRKAEKFFDVVTWTGNSTAGRTVAHNLGSAPKFVIVKRTDTANNWICWHSGIAITKYLQLNSTSPAYNDGGIFWDSTLPDASNITLGSDSGVNATGSTYVAYLFASDAGGYGDDGDENIIKCGSYTGNGSADGPEIDLGFEAQWVMIKRTDASGNDWVMMDIMRGMPADSGGAYLRANLSNNEAATAYMQPTPTGLKVRGTGSTQANASGATYIYIAIRRPMKTPESGTEVFALDTRGSTGDGKAPTYRSPFPADMQLSRNVNYAGGNTQIGARLLQATQMFTDLTAAESANVSMAFDYMNGVQTDTGTGVNQNAWMFKRATGFMDVVAYSGDGTASRQITHNLGSAPDMIIVKCRNATNTYWNTWHSSLPDDGSWASNLFLNSTDGYAGYQRFDGAATQTADYFTTGNNGEPNTSGRNYIAYLFASLDGVSKVGSYTGNAGYAVNVDCGFSAGARFILIKRTDSTGDWYYWDSLRGISAGNDPYLLLNSTAAQVTNTDYIDPLSSGFTVTSSAPAALNASGGTYIFLAIA